MVTVNDDRGPLHLHPLSSRSHVFFLLGTQCKIGVSDSVGLGTLDLACPRD